MAEFYQGQRAEDGNGNTLVYDTKRGWQAVDQQTAASYRNAIKDVQTQKDSYARIKGQAPLLQQADRMLGSGGWTNNGKVNTGGLANNLPWLPALGAALSPDADRFKNLGDRIQAAGGNPAQGQGAVSDYERRLFSAGSPSLQNFSGTNRDIIAQRQALIDEQRDYAAFLDEYVRRKGNADGAQAVWQEYVSADPYYGPSNKNPSRNVAYSKDPNRWRQYINEGMRPRPRQQGAAQPPRKAGSPSNLKAKYGLE